MNKTISINLGGYFFHIDEDAYQKLSRYFEAVKRSLSPEGRDEIVKDIESRIAELFQERIQNEKQVVGIKEIDEVISIMGQPEDYKINEDYNEATYDADYTNYGKSKKLYRDMDDSMLGGVMSGLGHYLGLDALWLRIIMVILFFGFGTGLLIYVILWILVPQAITTNQKLEMKGEPINISNIEKKVKEGFDEITGKFNNLDHQKIANTARNGANQVASTLGDIFLSVFKVFSKIIGAFMLFFASITLLGIIIASIVMLFSSTMPNSFIFNNFHSPIDFEVPIWLQGILLLFSVGIPFLFLLILGLKLLVNNMKPVGNYVKYSLLAIWIVSISALIYFGIQQATKVGFEGKTIQKEVLNIKSTDTLFIKMRLNDFYTKDINHRESYKYTHDQNNKEIIYSNDVKIHLMKTDQSTPYFQVEKTADGKSPNEAKNRAEKIKYNFDIQSNKLIFDNYFVTDFENKFRDQEVHIYIYLPNGYVIFPDESISDYLSSHYSDIDIYYGEEGYFYKLDNKDMICLNCPNDDEDRDDNEIKKLEIKINNKNILDSDSESITIKADEKGIRIEKNK